MLRALLGLALLLFVGGLAFYAGRASAPPSVAVTPAPAPTAPNYLPADPEQSRARIGGTPTLPDPPPITADVTPDEQLKQPKLPASVEGQVPGDSAPLFGRGIGLPLVHLKSADIHDTFAQARAGGERRHEATDIMAPRGTPVVAVDNGIIAKLFNSKPGGLTVYQFDPSQKYAYYYAHLDRYAEGLREGMLLKKGDLVGYVGSTGNADPSAPHLHFAIFELGPEKHWWEGKPLNPYPILMQAVGK